MTDEDPISVVQVRYARGEINTPEYEEFLSLFLNNIAFQQVLSLKIAAERYAQNEITIGQYKEILTHLIQDISSYQKSTPLRIVHMRYAEGQIETSEFEEKNAILMKDVSAFPFSPPLAVLFTRYAKGEIDTSRYREMLSHLGAYCSSSPIKEESKKSIDVEKKEEPSPKPLITPPVQKPVSIPSSSKPPDSAPVSDPYRLNFAASPAQSEVLHSPESAGTIEKIQERLSIGGEVQHFRPGRGIPDEGQVFIQSGHESTQNNDMYHITGLASPAGTITVLVKPESGPAEKSQGIPFKQDIKSQSDTRVRKDLTRIQEALDLQEHSLYSDIPIPEELAIAEETIAPSGDYKKIKGLIKQGKYQESVTRLDEILKQSPDDYRLLFLKSISLFNLGKGDEALGLLHNAKDFCTNKEDLKEIDRIYNHIILKEKEKTKNQEQIKISDKDKPDTLENQKKPTLLIHPDPSQVEHGKDIEAIAEKTQKLIDTGDYKGAEEILTDLPSIVKDIPLEVMQKNAIDDLFAAKGFVHYQLKDYCKAKKCFKEANRINPKNDTAIHYLNDVRIRDCNKFIRHM